MNWKTQRSHNGLGPVYCSSKFNHAPKTKTLATEASDLGIKSDQSPDGRIYNDAMDVGLSIQSRDTGDVATFYLAETGRDVDLDTVCWTYVPTTETLRKLPQLNGYTVVIFND